MLHLIITILVGAVVGSVSGRLMKKEKQGFWMNTLLGVVGGLVGGGIGSLLHISGGWIVGLVLSILGSCLIIWLVDKLKNMK